jgi:hypothetical protein
MSNLLNGKLLAFDPNVVQNGTVTVNVILFSISHHAAHACETGDHALCIPKCERKLWCQF